MGVKKLAAALGLVACLAACQTAVLRPLNWGVIPSYSQMEAPALFDTQPLGVIAGDAVPFDGFVVSTSDWRTFVGEYRRLQEALTLSQQGRGADRADCDEFVSTLQGEVVRLKDDRPRICALCAAGASSAAAVLTGAAVGQACD
jgi:hypothetical protein